MQVFSSRIKHNFRVIIIFLFFTLITIFSSRIVWEVFLQRAREIEKEKNKYTRHKENSVVRLQNQKQRSR